MKVYRYSYLKKQVEIKHPVSGRTFKRVVKDHHMRARCIWYGWVQLDNKRVLVKSLNGSLYQWEICE